MCFGLLPQELLQLLTLLFCRGQTFGATLFHIIMDSLKAIHGCRYIRLDPGKLTASRFKFTIEVCDFTSGSLEPICLLFGGSNFCPQPFDLGVSGSGCLLGRSQLLLSTRQFLALGIKLLR